MSEAYENMMTRRSVRKYLDTPVPAEVIDRIITAGLYAPTGRNMQSPIIVAVTDRELRDRLSRMNAAVMGSDGDPFYGAPAVLVVLADRSCRTHVYDGSLVMGNLMLAAHDAGLGSCWIHCAREVFDTDEGREILRGLGIEGDYEGIGHCVIGYVNGEYPKTSPRRENRVFYVE